MQSHSLQSSRSYRFSRNVAWSLGGQLGVAAIAFFATPYLLQGFGKAGYGLYILLITITDYLVILIFGSGSATVKYLSESRAKGDARGVRDTIAYAGFFAVAGVSLGACVTVFTADFLVETVFKVPPALVESGVWIVRFGALAAVFVALFRCSCAALQGMHRFDLHSGFSLLQNALMTLGVVALLGLGFGLFSVGAWHMVLNAGLAMAAMWSVWRLLRPELMRRCQSGGLRFKEYASYGFVLWLGQLAWVTIFKLDRLLIGARLSLTDLTIYGIPSGLLQRLNMLPAAIDNVLVPMISELQDEELMETLPKMYLKSLRVLLWFVLPVLVLLFALMPQFLSLWIGEGFSDRGVWPARLLVMSQAFLVLYSVPNAVLVGRGKPLGMTGVVWAQAVVSVVCWYFLLPRLGIFGVALGALLAQMLPLPFYLGYVHRRFVRITTWQYLTRGLYRPFVCAFVMLAVFFPFHHLADSWLRLIVFVVCGCVFYYGATWLSLQPDERTLLKRLMRLNPSCR